MVLRADPGLQTKSILSGAVGRPLTPLRASVFSCSPLCVYPRPQPRSRWTECATAGPHAGLKQYGDSLQHHPPCRHRFQSRSQRRHGRGAIHGPCNCGPGVRNIRERGGIFDCQWDCRRRTRQHCGCMMLSGGKSTVPHWSPLCSLSCHRQALKLSRSTWQDALV
jgi:hypothetical protein